MQNTTPPSTKILRKHAVVDRVGLSSTTIWRLTKAQQFPPAVRLTANTVGWREREVDAWCESRTATRDAPRQSPNPKARRR